METKMSDTYTGEFKNSVTCCRFEETEIQRIIRYTGGLTPAIQAALYSQNCLP